MLPLSMGTAHQDIEYRVVKTPTESDLTKIPLNLLIEEPWISVKHPKYPQELTLVLRKESNIEKIQLLSHNAFISHKIDLFAGSGYGTKKEHWKQLGTVTLKSVKSSDTKHELKTVYLDEVCNAMKLKLHQNYEHKTANPDNQVGIVQFRLVGRTMAMAREMDAFKYVAEEPKRELKKADERPEMDTTYSDEIEGVIDSMERSKARAIKVSDFQLAKSATHGIRSLSKAKKEMEELERDQSEAVKNDDFERAHDIRQEMKTFRANILASVDPNLIDDQPPNDPLHAKVSLDKNLGIYRPRELFDDEVPVYPPPHPKLFEPIKLSPTEKYAPIDLNFLIPPKPPKKNTRQNSADSTRSSLSSASSFLPRSTINRTPSPLMHAPRQSSNPKKFASAISRHDRSESPQEKTLKGILRRPASVDRGHFIRTPSPLPRTPSPLPTIERGGRKKIASAHRSSSFTSSSSSRPSKDRNLFQEKENMILPAVMRSRSASDSELTLRPLANRTPSRRIEDVYDLVHPDEKSALREGTRIFGADTMSKTYAKEWELRKEGLQEIQAYLKENSFDKETAEDVIKPVITIIARLLRDKLHTVYSEALSLLEYTCIEFIPKNNLLSYAAPLGEHVHETIVNKAGDAITDPRSASQTMESVKRILAGNKKVAKTFMNKFIKSKEREGTRAEKGRAKIISEAAIDHSAPNTELGLTSLNVARFGAACMKSTDSDVRTIGKELFLQVYNDSSADKARLRKFLPGQKTHEAQSSIFKQLYSEMSKDPLRRSTSKSAKSVRIREDAKEGTDDDKYDKMCMFCGTTRESFNPAQLDIHYVTECPMLTTCQNCNEIIEVAEMRDHLIKDCRAKELYKLCPTCKEPIERKDYHRHVGKKKCHPSPPNCSRCLLCGKEVSPSNDLGWRRHLLEECDKGRGKKKRKISSQRSMHNLHFIPR